MALNPAAVARLAEKYARLLELRQRRAAGEPIPERSVFRELAREFPGALYELDTLPLDALEVRVAETGAVARGGEPAAWIALMIGYHALFRAALFVKARAAKGGVDEVRAEALARAASAHVGVEVDASFARRAAKPPGGRLQAVVLDALAEEAGLTTAAVKKAIFPQSRR